MKINFGTAAKKQTIRCDVCKTVLQPKPVKISYTTKGGKKLGVTYFKCKRCNEIYLVMVEDGANEELTKERLRLTKFYGVLVNKAKEQEKKQHYLQEYSHKVEELKTKQRNAETKLRQQYSEEIINYLKNGRN